MATNNGLNNSLANCNNLPATGFAATGTPSASTFLRGDASWSAISLTPGTGRLLNIQYLTASGTYTATAGTNSISVEALGAGGGGGGVPATLINECAAGGGGGGGAYGFKYYSVVPTGTAFVIGAGGAGGISGAAGSAGTATTFNAADMNVLGGGGASSTAATANTTATGYIAGGLGGDITGVNNSDRKFAGNAGGKAFFTNGLGYSGAGGIPGGLINGSLSYVDISTAGSGTQGSSTVGYGVGGVGSAANGVGSGTNGRAGAPGLIIVYEYS